jgi:hypothetical protein
LATGAVLSVIISAHDAAAQMAPDSPTTISVGDWKLAPVFDLRLRGEYRHDLDAHDRALLIERTRIGLDAVDGPLEMRVVLEDARAIALTSGTFVEGPLPIALTGAYDAWAQVHTASVRPSFVRAGRQPITWGEGRLLGESDWSPTGRSLDALRGRLVFGDGAAEVLGAAVEGASARSFALDAYAALLGVRGEWVIAPLFALEAYALARLARENPPPDVDLSGSVRGQTYTGAFHLHGDGQGWNWGTEAALQLGHVDGVPRFGVASFSGGREAWAAAGHVSRTFGDIVLSPVFVLGVSYASGDRVGPMVRAFDPLFPDAHTWHGAMDVFSWSNEEEANLRVALAPWTDAMVAVEYRYARLAEIADAWRSGYLETMGQSSRNSSADLGHEVDAVLRWSPLRSLDFEVGYSCLFLGTGARALILASQGSADAVSHFAYTQIRVGF